MKTQKKVGIGLTTLKTLLVFSLINFGCNQKSESYKSRININNNYLRHDWTDYNLEYNCIETIKKKGQMVDFMYHYVNNIESCAGVRKVAGRNEYDIIVHDDEQVSVKDETLKFKKYMFSYLRNDIKSFNVYIFTNNTELNEVNIYQIIENISIEFYKRFEEYIPLDVYLIYNAVDELKLFRTIPPIPE